jgi:hypothetical protein
MKKPILKNIGQNIKRIQKRKGITQVELGSVVILKDQV